jgi:hypothetical protein
MSDMKTLVDNMNYDEVSSLIDDLQILKKKLKSEKSIQRLELRKEKKQKTQLKRLETINQLELKLMKVKSKSIYKNSEVVNIDVSEYNKELV